METTPISQRRLIRFWAPLQATWFFMAVENPFLAAVIARLAAPEYNLAAFGVAYAFALMVEAPVIMMLSAATALVDSRPGYLALRRFAQVLNGLITAIMLLLLATGAMGWILRDLMRLDAEVARLTINSLWVLLPWPAAIGYRRFYQGILIRSGRTELVTVGTALRLGSMVAAGLTAAAVGLDGVMVGAVALTCGVLVEALASRLFAHGSVRDLPAQPPADRQASDLSWKGLTTFYWPLALTTTISLAVHPLVTFFMGWSRAPLESLAVLPVVNGLVFLFRTPGLSYQETAIAMLGESPRNARPVFRFAGALMVGASLGLALVAWTPLATIWLQRISGLSGDLAGYAILPLRIMTLMPALSVLLNLERALLVHGRRTIHVTQASIMEVIMIAAVLAVGVFGFNLIGATAAALAFMAGRLAANTMLLKPARAVIMTRET